jgi:uncharacterized protein (TIGR02246 family)
MAAVDSMQALLDQFETAFNAKDAAQVARGYVDDGRILAPGQDVIQGRTAIESFIASMFEMGVRSVHFDVLSRDQRQELGFEVGRYEFHAEPDGPAIDTGKYVSVRRQQPDGSWLIDVDIFNSNTAPDADS